MEFKLNEQGIETYVASLTSKLLEDFFKTNTYVSGKDILSFTSYEQINFFILKNLFMDWQAEMTRLKSPYFDYENKEVQEALSALMNKLSHHIKINQEDFEGLLYNSIYDTIELVCAPKEFITNNLLDFSTETISVNELKDISKYVKVNAHLFDELLTNYGGEQELVLKELKLHLNSEYENLKKENLEVDSFVNSLCSLMPVTKSDFFIPEKKEDLSVDEQESSKELLIEFESEEKPEEKTPVEVVEEKTAVIDTKPIKEIVSDPEKLEPKTLNDKFQKKEVPANLNKKLSTEEKANLAAELQKKSVGSIKSSIGLNQKFMFQKTLFGGNNEDYEFAINRLDDFDNYEEVSNFLIDNYAQKYDWSDYEKEVSELFQLVAKKF